jgi:hypothetical protein
LCLINISSETDEKYPYKRFIKVSLLGVLLGSVPFGEIKFPSEARLNATTGTISDL